MYIYSSWNVDIKKAETKCPTFKTGILTSNYLLETLFTALFNNTRTLKLKAQPTNAFFAAVNQVFGGPPSLRILPNSVRCLNSAQRFDQRALGSSRKLGGAAKRLIDGSEKRICRLSFEF